ncbi:MAG: hypothetical protein ABI318_14390 [Chthoniobacteraceae bacterium]
MNAAQVLAEIAMLPRNEKLKVVGDTFRQLAPEDLKSAERLLRRIAYPDVPDEVWEGFEQCEDGRTVEMDVALSSPPPGAK